MSEAVFCKRCNHRQEDHEVNSCKASNKKGATCGCPRYVDPKSTR